MLAAADPYNVIADICFNIKGHLIVTCFIFFPFSFAPSSTFHYLFSLSTTYSAARETAAVEYRQVVTACSILTTALFRHPLSGTVRVLQETYASIEIALPDAQS